MLSSQFLYLATLLVALVEANVFVNQPISSNGFDLSLYEEVLDPEECVRQMSYISSNFSLLFRFMDAGPRTPRGIMGANLIDLGSYNECLGISYQEDEMSIEGKYCLTSVPIVQASNPTETASTFQWTNLRIEELFANMHSFDDETIEKLKAFESGRNGLLKTGRRHESSDSRGVGPGDMGTPTISFNLGICIPKVCSTEQYLNILTRNMTENLRTSEVYCRLPNDKPRVAADYVAIVIFSIIGLLTLLSTAYDIQLSILQKKDPKEANKTFMLFSVYTNTKKLFTFKHNPNAIECLDGIRSLAMLWVVIGHTFSQYSFLTSTPIAVLNYLTAFNALWVSSAPITVDTFFMLSGFLLVYTTANKLSGISLLKNLHLFYLNRLLRMFPVLATAVLLQASFFNRISDGPVWTGVVQYTNDCREKWWSTLLYVQNYVNPLATCLPHSWYLAIDMQLYILSPIVLFWMLTGNKKAGWIAMIGTFLAVMAAATTYNFIMEFPATTFTLSRPADSEFYVEKYYMNTLTRAAPFLVGMIFGYLMHQYRGKTVIMPKIYVAILWVLAAAASTTIFITPYYVMQRGWDNQTVDSIINSFMRPVWAACVSWMVFACKHGYGGPIDWFLSLHIFKILSRLSYAMYIMHYCLQNIVTGTLLAPPYFSPEFAFQRFLSDFPMAVMAALLVMVVIDAPCTGIIGIVLGGSNKNNNNNMKKNEDLNTNKSNLEEK